MDEELESVLIIKFKGKPPDGLFESINSTESLKSTVVPFNNLDGAKPEDINRFGVDLIWLIKNL